MRDRRWVESAVEEAIARGDFADLPGAGKPLDLPETHDPDWWIKGRLEGDDVDRDALLPTVVLLRREREGLDETLALLPDEASARAYAEDFSERVLADRRENRFARMLAATLDADEAAQRWRELRALREHAERERVRAAQQARLGAPAARVSRDRKQAGRRRLLSRLRRLWSGERS